MGQDEGSKGRRASVHAELVRGEPAKSLLADPKFRQEWDLLLTRCPWSTVFQSPRFVTTWFDIYGDLFEPVLILGRTPDSVLVGAMILARHQSTGDLFFAGTNQAEYHTFLAHGTDPLAFLEAAVHLLRRLGARRGLRFHFLAAGTPLEWLARGAIKGGHLQVQAHARPLMDLTDPATVIDPLQKKRHKSRMTRLGKAGGGEVRLVQLQGSAEMLPYLDEIIGHCDLRQGAVNRNTPFRSDPRKRAFYLRMLDEPNQMHATVLLAGDRMAAAHIGPISGRQVVLGLIVHSALFAQHSPGKLLVLLLGELLARQGYEALDLTPGEGYKAQFTSRSDTVHAVQLHWERGTHLRQVFRAGLRRRAVRLARFAGFTHESLERLTVVRNRLLNWRRWPHVIWVLGERVAGVVWKQMEYRIYMAPEALPVATHRAAGRLHRQRVADLLQYAPESGLPDDYHAFLSVALTRLEHGQVSYTYAAEGQLLHYSWLIPSARECGTGLGDAPVRFYEESAVLWDDFTHPAGRGRGLHTESIRCQVEEVQRTFPGRHAFAGVHANNHASRDNFERWGFVHVASAWYRCRIGWVERWVTYQPGSVSLFKRG